MRLLPSRLNNKPQYVFHPTRAWRRATYRGDGEQDSRATAQLPWGLPLEVYRSDAIGYSILTGGVFDPAVSETLHRLIDPGDVVVDVGANVGYLTSLAAVRAGGGGTVVAYEPHPSVFALLQANAARWQAHGEVAGIEIRQAAMSDRSGTGQLEAGPLFHLNMGLAALRSPDAPAAPIDTVTVALERLDDEVESRTVGLLKIDVEGHEPSVLRGAQRLLDRRQIRDLVFEDHEPYPSEATKVVERAGYELVSLDNDLFGLLLETPEDRRAITGWPGPSYLATRDMRRALARLKPRGWQIEGIGLTLPRSLRRRGRGGG